MLRAGFAPRFPARGAGVCPGAALPPLPGQSQEPLAPLPAPRPVPSAVLGSAWEEEGAPVCWDHPGRCPKAGWALGCPWLCNPGTPCLPAAGRGDADYGDLRDEGHYLYLDEDGSGWGSAGPLEVLAGPARCQDTYPDWISLYCWAPFHATLMATPEGSRCCWDQISRWVHVGPAVPDAHWEQGRRGGRVPVASGRPHAAPSAAPTASSPAAPSCWPSCSPAPGPAPASMPSSCSRPHAQQSPERGSNPSRQLPSPWLPLRLRGAGNSPLPSQPWELRSGMRVRGTGQSGEGDLGIPGEEAGPVARGGGWAWGSRYLRLPWGWGGTGRRVLGSGVLTLHGPSPFLGTPGGWLGAPGMPGWGRGAPALAGGHHQVPARPRRMPRRGRLAWPRGHAEIIGCLPGRGSRHPARGSSGSNKEQDQGGSNLWPPACQGLTASRLHPRKVPRCPGGAAAAAREGPAGSARTFAGEREAWRAHPSAAGRVPPSCASSSSDSRSARPGRAVKGEALGSRSAPGQR
ncbi:uncharacterized protein LOC141934348 isoform X1 [Strix aluco]|uniref:uncharacterized protein LOC141934348 isoform X1 n=1 Tax=Strix aluco TaxID=111821 RepID=UPI003DA2D9CD